MDKELKQLARLVVEEKVDTKKVESIVAKLADKDLKVFLKFLKQAIARNTVTVASADSITKEVALYFEKKYIGKRIVYSQNEELGAGVVVKIDDDVYDYTVRNYLATTIANLEREL